MRSPLTAWRGHVLPGRFPVVVPASASATDCSALKSGNIIFFPAGTVQLNGVVSVGWLPVSVCAGVVSTGAPSKNHIRPVSWGQLPKVDDFTEYAHCHQFSLHWPYVCPPSLASIGRTPGFILSANAIVDPRSAIATTANTMLLRQFFRLTFITIYLLITREKSHYIKRNIPTDGKIST